MASRKNSASEIKKSGKSKANESKDEKNCECNVCKSVVGADDKAIECEICKGWFHISCVDIKHNEYEVLAAHLLGTIHWYCADCNLQETHQEMR